MEYQEVYDNTKREDLHQVLEALVDRHTLNNVLYDLINVCYAKSEHLEANWQDTRQSKIWERIANKLDTLNAKTPLYV